MKRMKKIASILLAMVMVLGMSMTVFATEPSDPTEPTGSPEAPSGESGQNETLEGGGDAGDVQTTGETQQPTATVTHTYEIYQIFTGRYDDGVLSDIKWGKNGTGTEGEKVADNVLEALEDVTNNTSDTAQLAVIQQYANLSSTPVKTGSETTYTGLTPGYYLVKDKDGSLTGTNVPYTLYVVRVIDGTLSFSPKGEVPKPDKKIVEGTDKVTTNEASIGDEVNYEITASMPSNIADYDTYRLTFTDTLSKGLTYKEKTITVTVDGIDVTSYFSTTIGEDSETAGTTIEVSIQNLKAVGNITDKTVVVLTYTATLNEKAVIAGEGNPNNVKLTYSNDPNNSGAGGNHPTGESPEVSVDTYTTELTILKTDEDDKFLPGVEFTLTGNGVNIVLVTEETFAEAAGGEYWKLKDGTYTKTAPTEATNADYDNTTTKYTKTTSVVAKGNGKTDTNVVGTVQADGTVTFKGLGAGEYTITETKTLPGYNTIDPITFTLTFDKTTKKFTSNNDKVTAGTDNMLDSSIINQKGSLLPSTGGIGTTIFYVVGGVLVIGAGILLVAKKRMSSK